MKTEYGRVLTQIELQKDIFDIKIELPQIVEEACVGQFVSIYLKDKSKLLPRPISICGIDKKEKSIRLVYRVTGEHTGTKEISRYAKGDIVKILGPLGNGFPLDSERTMLIGGGIGIPPLLETAKQLNGEVICVLGYRDRGLFLKEEFDTVSTVYVATEDGSMGTKGNVIDLIKEKGLEAKRILACGPTPMLRAIQIFAKEHGIECYLSLEEHMACGIGACLACVCKTKEKNSHTHVYNTRICKEGPVFRAEEIIL